MNIKKVSFRILAIIISFALLVATLLGCNRDADVIIDEPGYVFIPEFTSISALAGDLPNISNIIVVDNTIYLTSTSDMNESFFQTTHIFTIDLDESEITYLPNYTTSARPIDANIGGGVFISAMQVDSDGNLWIAETENHTFFDLPANFDFDHAELHEIWGHLASVETSYVIRKLDGTGTELLAADVNALASSAQNWVGINAFNVDADGNLFIGSGQSIYALDIDGNTLFRLETEIFVQENSLIKMPDGAIAHSGWDSSFHSLRLQLIDTQSRAWGEAIDLPENTRSIFPGNDEFLILADDGRDLFGIANDSGDIIPILDWIGSGVDPVGIDNVSILPNDRIMLTTTVFCDSGDDWAVLRHTELIVLNRTPYDELDDVTVITIATSSPFIFNSAVLEFNRTNPMYRIEFLEVEFGATWVDDVERLALEIIAGRGPDILHTSGFPFPQWARHGVFVDLYDFLDSDSSLDRSDFIESVLRSAEIDGRLYQVFPDFNILTLFGHPDVVGENRGWNFEEFRTVIENNPQATHPLGTAYNAERLLQSIYLNNIESFVNWDSGTVYFDSDFFIEILEFIYIFNTTMDTDEGFAAFEPYRMISSGEQIMLATGFFGFDFYSIYQDLFGGDFVFKGFPSEYGSGNFLSTSNGLAILNSSNNQQIAWEFISKVMSDEWQREHTQFSIPISNVVFEEELANATVVEVDEFGESVESVGFADLQTTRRPLTEEHVDNIRALVDSASVMMIFEDSLWDVIIWEVVEDFFNGALTAQDAARIIQNRAERFVAEQS
ncbi:MAG: extracellular solute-binding protein [Oscillospiraceae bacterium]|nr:extracellular solute-binding protein [Oscillospiraceae bacterium]